MGNAGEAIGITAAAEDEIRDAVLFDQLQFGIDIDAPKRVNELRGERFADTGDRNELLISGFENGRGGAQGFEYRRRSPRPETGHEGEGDVTAKVVRKFRAGHAKNAGKIKAWRPCRAAHSVGWAES